jgi:hypothetical protein
VTGEIQIDNDDRTDKQNGFEMQKIEEKEKKI